MLKNWATEVEWCWVTLFTIMSPNISNYLLKVLSGLLSFLRFSSFAQLFQNTSQYHCISSCSTPQQTTLPFVKKKHCKKCWSCLDNHEKHQHCLYTDICWSGRHVRNANFPEKKFLVLSNYRSSTSSWQNVSQSPNRTSMQSSIGILQFQ